MSIHKAGSLGLSTIGINDELSVHRNLNVDSLVRDITSNGEAVSYTHLTLPTTPYV